MINETSRLLDENKDLILELYASGVSVGNIANRFNTHLQPISTRLKKWLNRTSLLSDPGNLRYFQHIDSPIKAYFIGLIAADGALVKTGCGISLTITIHIKDRVILDKLREEIGCEHQLQLVRNGAHIRFVLSRKELISDLKELGLTERKSLTMSNFLQHIPADFRKAAILGYFDGDGSIMYRFHQGKYRKQAVQIRATDALISGIMKEYPYIPYHVAHFDAIPNLAISSLEGVLSFFEIYQHCNFYLPRKYETFISLIHQVQTSSSSRDQRILRELGARVPIIADALKDLSLHLLSTG